MISITPEIFCFTLLIPVFAVIYLMLPSVYILITGGYKYTEKKRVPQIVIGKIFKYIPGTIKLKNGIISRLDESGIADDNTWIFWGVLTIGLPIIVLLVMIILGYGLFISIIALSGCCVLPNIYINYRINYRKTAFLMNAYKLYNFLHSQISSGIKATDAVRGIHEIVENLPIRETLIRFVARYELTLNIEESLEVIRRSFKGYDAEMLCVSIKQCIETGQAGKTLLKMEKLMFSKYFHTLQKETEKYKTCLLIAGLFGIIPIIILMTLPLVYEALSGFKQVLYN